MISRPYYAVSGGKITLAKKHMYSVADESVSVMKTRPSGFKNCNFNEIINEEKLIKLGGVPVPSTYGSGCTSWAEITEQMKKKWISS